MFSLFLFLKHTDTLMCVSFVLFVSYQITPSNESTTGPGVKTRVVVPKPKFIFISSASAVITR